MANNNNNQRRGQLKNIPTTASTYIKMMLGMDAWDISISQEQLEAKVLQAINANPEIAKIFTVVSYTMSPEVKQKITNIEIQMGRVQESQDKRQKEYDTWKESQLFDKEGNKKKPTEAFKKEDKKRQKELKSQREDDAATMQQLAEAHHDLKYPEEIKEREAAHENARNEAKQEKLIDTIAAAEEKKENAKKKKVAFIGGAIGEAIENVGKGFQEGRHLRGY